MRCGTFSGPKKISNLQSCNQSLGSWTLRSDQYHLIWSKLVKKGKVNHTSLLLLFFLCSPNTEGKILMTSSSSGTKDKTESSSDLHFLFITWKTRKFLIDQRMQTPSGFPNLFFFPYSNWNFLLCYIQLTLFPLSLVIAAPGRSHSINGNVSFFFLKNCLREHLFGIIKMVTVHLNWTNGKEHEKYARKNWKFYFLGS